MSRVPARRAWTAALVLSIAVATSRAAADPERHGVRDDDPDAEPEPAQAHPIRALEEIVFVNGPIGASWYWWNQDFNQVDWDLRWDWPSWHRKLVTFDAVRFDSNDFATNAGNHTFSGAAYYWLARANRLSILESFAVANVGSLTWEYLVEFREMPSLNDIVFTPFAGMAMGETLFQLGELFDRGSDATGVRILAALFGGPRKLHDLVDGVPRGRARETDPMGLPSDVYHRFEFSSGLSTVVSGASSGDASGSRAELAIESEIVTLPHYGGAGHVDGSFGDRGFTSLRMESVIGDHRTERFALDARATLFGRYRHDVSHDRSGELSGTSVFAGVLSGLDYSQRWIGLLSDRIAVARLLGPTLDVSAFTGGVHLRAALDVTADFAMVTAFAGPAYLASAEPASIRSVLAQKGYYYAYGVSAAPTFIAQWSVFDLRVAARVDLFTSIDGRDRVQQDVADDARLSDRRIEWRTSAGLSPIPLLRLHATFTERWREGRVSSFSNSALERTVMGGISIVL
jgi:hypothetical protein